MPRVTALKINSVWSSYGHTFISGEPEMNDENVVGYYESCLTCGAEYVLRATPGLGDGSYQANDGSEPRECTGDTSMVHGYSGEREYQDGTTDHDCNCILCDS